MKRIFNIILCVAALACLNACSDEYLETSSPSVVDSDFVFSNSTTARAAMYGVYEAWRSVASQNVFGDGLYYSNDVAGSDIERHPEAWKNQPARHYPEGLYDNGSYTSQYVATSYSSNNDTGAYAQLFEAIAKANFVITSFEEADNYDELLSVESPTALSQMYGEAICARACCYRELLRQYGDVPFKTRNGLVANGGIAPRDSIYDSIIADLEKVAPIMYRVGQGEAAVKNIYSRTFAEAMIGRMCLDAAGYQTRRVDLGTDFYVDGKGNKITLEQKGQANAQAGGAVYARRSDYKTLYEKAQKYFLAVINNPGSAKFYLTDPRGDSKNGKTYGNPYQYFFQQMNDLEYADESIYEYAQTQGTGNDSRPYSFGRPSSGGSSNAFPCKSYGQGRINPAFYWGVFDPNDMRRDVSICLTGSSGGGAEVLIPFTPNSKAAGGGLSLNKWDENRMSNPYCLKQRTSGINGPYMRMAEVYLGYAECCAVLGQTADAKSYLAKVRERSFPAGLAKTDDFINVTCGGDIVKAVINERGFEFAGEGDRRWTLIRTGYFPEAIKSIKELTAKMIEGLAADGYYRFDNGNEIPAYVWTKTVNGNEIAGYRLTTQTPDGLDENSDKYAMLYPGWRGQNDDWAAAGRNIGVTEANITKNLKAGDMTNLAIKGLFKHIAPDSAEAAALESAGYAKVAYGSQIVSNADEYCKYLFYNYDYTSAPIYLWPFTVNTCISGGITNGYGFPSE